jgi:hypothetical protein
MEDQIGEGELQWIVSQALASIKYLVFKIQFQSQELLEGGERNVLDFRYLAFN